MRIKALRHLIGAGALPLMPGDQADLDDIHAERLIAAGVARAVEAPAEPDPFTADDAASRRPKRGRK